MNAFEFNGKEMREYQNNLNVLRKQFEDYIIVIKNITKELPFNFNSLAGQFISVINSISEISEDMYSFERSAGEIYNIYYDAGNRVRELLTEYSEYGKRFEFK